MERQPMQMASRVVAMAGVLLAAGLGARPAAAGPADLASSPLSLTVDLSRRTLTVEKNGERVGTYAVAIGRPSHPTPTGTFRVGHIVWNPHWIPPDSKWARGRRPRAPGERGNPMGRVKLFFREPDLYIHGTRDVDSLGEAESHGCIRMRNGDAIELARMVMQNGGAAQE